MTARHRGPIYLTRLRGPPGMADIHALRALLKTLLRRYRLRCISVGEEPLTRFRREGECPAGAFRHDPN